MVSVVPGIWNLEGSLEVAGFGICWSAMTERRMPPRMACREDASDKIPQRKQGRKHIIFIGRQDGDRLDLRRGGLKFCNQAIVVDGSRHERDAPDGKIHLQDRLQNHAGAKAVRSERNTGGVCKIGIDEWSDELTSVVRDPRLEGIVETLTPD